MESSGSITARQIIPVGVRIFRIDSYAAQVASNDPGGNPTQWIYQVTELHKSSPGYGTADPDVVPALGLPKWSAIGSEGYSGNAYNFLENENTGADVQQNGVDHSATSYPAGFKMQPLKANSPHPGIILEVDDASGYAITECWLFPYSGEDGACT